MLGQPGLQLAIGLDLFLQRLEGFHARGQLGLPGGLGIQGLLALAPLVIELGHAVLQLHQHRLRHLGHLGGVRVLGADLLQPVFVGGSQRIAIVAQALQPGFVLAGLLVQAALLGGQHLDLLLHLHHLLALGIGLVLGGAQCVFEVRQALALLFQLRGQHFGLLFGIHAAGGQVLQFGLGIVLALCPLGDLLGQLLHALLDALAALDHVADLGLQLAHLGRGFVQPSLGLVDLVAGLVVRLAHSFQIGLDVADFRHAAFQLVDGL